MDAVTQVREKIDLVALISTFIPLQKMGRNFKANCPFHGEKTPSFVVSPERQIWHCFGCGKGGDCFTFLMEYEHLEFPEALRTLAKQAGVVLVQSAFETQVTSKKEKLYTINKLAAEYYHYILTKHAAGKQAREYLLEKRKLHPGLLETFLIGFSPNQNDSLVQYLLKKKDYKREDLEEAGLVAKRTGQPFDFFFNRIMFPLFDHRDNILAFSGRSMSDTVQPKYINTRDTLVYQKGTHFFGLHLAKNAIKKENQAIVTEGEFDVISAFSQGIENVIAVKGSALTPEHVQLLSRFTQKVTLCFDGDSAGQEAIKRSLGALEKKGMTTTVIQLVGGKDPDEVIKNDPIAFKKAIKADISVYDFLLEKAIKAYGTETAEGKKRISDEVLPIYMAIENEIVKEHYLHKLSTQLQSSLESIVKQGEKIAKKQEKTTVEIAATSSKKPREEVLESYLLSLIVQSPSPKEAVEAVYAVLTTSNGELLQFKTGATEKLLEYLASFCKQEATFESGKFLAYLPKELLPVFDTSYLFPLPKFDSEAKQLKEAQTVAKEIKMLWLRSRMKELASQIQVAEEKNDESELDILQKDFSEIALELKKFARG